MLQTVRDAIRELGGPDAVPPDADAPFIFGRSETAADVDSTSMTPSRSTGHRTPLAPSSSSKSSSICSPKSSHQPSSPKTSEDLLHSGRMLGDLPSLSAHRSPSVHDSPTDAKRTGDLRPDPNPELGSPLSPAGGGKDIREVPQEFLCEISKRPLVDPVVTPFGNVFERSVIANWMERNGSICPLTGQPLSKSELREATEVRARMEKWTLEREMQRTRITPAKAAKDTAPQVAEDDLYDF